MGVPPGSDRLVVCVPDAALGAKIDRSDAVEVVVWDGDGAPVVDVAPVTMLIPPHRVEPLSKAQLELMPTLKLIQLLSLGVEHWSPSVPTGVTLCNGGDLFAASTAELALGGILHLLHEMPEVIERQGTQTWARRTRRDLAGTSVLVVGAGHVGHSLRRALEVFGARVTVVGRSERPGVVAVHQLGELVPQHDIVVLAVPLTPETHHLADASILRSMPDGGILINVGRGRLVDQEALVRELASGRLRAMLDVVDPEPLPRGHPLWSVPGLLLTPHMGGETVGWRDRAADLVALQVRRVAGGMPPLHVVGPARCRPGLGSVTP